MAETEDEMSDAGLNFTTRSRLLSWNQKQLRELAREVSQNIPQNWLLEGKCWLRWTFGTEVYHLDPDRYLDIRDWSDPQLERLLQQLRDGDVLVEAVNDKEIAAAKFVNALNVSGLNSSKASQKRYRAPDRLKERLVQTIETAVGRRLVQCSLKAIDPRNSDPEPPNLYNWRFSQEYLAFPDTKGGISRWTAEQIRCCNNALDKGYLTVVVVEHGSAEQAAMRQQRDTGALAEEEVDDSCHHSDQEIEDATRHEDLPPNGPSEVSSQGENGNRSQLEEASPTKNDDAQSVAVGETERTIKEEVGSTCEQAKNVHGLVKGLSALHSRMVDTMLDMVRTKQIQELEHTLKSKHEIKVNKLKKEADELKRQLHTEQGAKHDAVAKISGCQMQINALKDLAKKHSEELSVRLANARREGELAGKDKAIKDLHAVNEGERLALQRNYLDQLDKVKNDSYQLGYDAGRKTYSGQNINEPQKLDLKVLKRTHDDELKSAREASLQEGRDMAYKELALGPEDRINSLVQNHNELDTNRKTIHQNWVDVPQRALPSYMLPEGHTAGDKTLYLLAKLSKEVNAARASQLLTEEIDRRCHNLPRAPMSRIVTNADIRNVLDQIRTTNESTGHAASLESSMTPQPSVQQSSSDTTTSIKISAQNRTPMKNSLAPYVSSIQTSRQDYSTPAGNVQGVRKTPHESLQPAKATPSKPNPVVKTNGFQPPKERNVEDTLKALPPPPRIHLPSGLQTFSSKFIQQHIGGREYTFSKISPDRENQIVPWRTIIRVNAELHRYAPRLGVHGALMLVQGKSDNGTIGSCYPIILKMGTDQNAYLGQYKLIGRDTVPVATWLDEPEETRIRIAKEVAETRWGEQLLRDKKIELDETTLQDRVDQILRCFENNDNQPNLRMEWAVLQLIDFKHENYKALQTALSKTQEKGPKADQNLQSAAFTRLNILELATKQWLDLNVASPSAVNFSASEASRLAALVVKQTGTDRMFGKNYKTKAEFRQLKEYIVKLTLQIKTSFPLMPVETHEEITRAFNAVYALFDRHNVKVLRTQRTESVENLNRRQRASFQKPGGLSTSSSVSQKRRNSNSDAPVIKRPKTSAPTPWGELNAWEKNLDGSLVEGPNGSTIFVDAGSEEPGVKADEDNGVKEDLYNATPTLKGRGRGRPRKSAAA